MLCWVIHSSTSKQVATKSGFDFDTVVLWMVGFGIQAYVVWINNVGFDAAPRTVFLSLPVSLHSWSSFRIWRC
jgi:hypothetical protein